MSLDVVVVGGGPAAWAAAAAVAEAGLAVGLVASDPDATWPATYGVWIDELDGLGLGDPFRARWEEVVVVGHERHVLTRPYAIFDNAALATVLAERVAANDGPVLRGRVVGANHDRWRSTVVLADGRTLTGKVIVDASGADAALVQHPTRPRPAYQTARGLVAAFERPPIPEGSCVLMDLSGGPDHDPDPTFLYALDLGAVTLVEETSLARARPMSAEELTRRLEARLTATGARAGRVVAEEAVHIAMGGGLPSPSQREVGFGAAGGLVHPATGYSVGASLRAAPRLARALADALVGRRATPAAASRAAWSAVWPAGRRRARRLERYGLEVLVRLDRGGQRAFFDAFFSLDQHLWAGYVSGTLPGEEVGTVMREVFGRVPRTVRRQLVRGNPLGLLAAR